MSRCKCPTESWKNRPSPMPSKPKSNGRCAECSYLSFKCSQMFINSTSAVRVSGMSCGWNDQEVSTPEMRQRQTHWGHFRKSYKYCPKEANTSNCLFWNFGQILQRLKMCFFFEGQTMTNAGKFVEWYVQVFFDVWYFALDSYKDITKL